MSNDDAYFIEVERNGCERCGHGKTWVVVGPDGVAGSVSYEDSSEAQDMADALNEAFWHGRTEPSRTTAARAVPEKQP